MRIMIVLVGLLLVGCADAPAPVPLRDLAVVTVRLVDQMPSECGNPEPFGCWIERLPGVSEIYILKAYYPECLKHELRHAFEGDWHPGRRSVEDC